MWEDSKKLIVGLGNPGQKYKNTRHNIGFKVVDALGQDQGEEVSQKKFNSLYTKIRCQEQSVILAKPQTYMNRSGQTVRQIVDYFQIPLPSLMIVYDDIDLDPGKLRFKRKGSSGGHNGVRSIIDHLGTRDFPRLKIGIGRPSHKDQVNYVLGRFSPEEEEVMDEAVAKAVKALQVWLKEGLTEVMNQFN